jgi:hypothetical protein
MDTRNSTAEELFKLFSERASRNGFFNTRYKNAPTFVELVESGRIRLIRKSRRYGDVYQITAFAQPCVNGARKRQTNRDQF